MTPQPLLILCPGGSFSSVVCAAVGQHPQMYGLPELNLFIRDTLGEILDLDVPLVGVNALTGLRRALAQVLCGEQTVETIGVANAWMAERRDRTGAQVFEALSELVAPRALVEKAPSNSHPDALRRIGAAFPDAFVLHLVRHPRGTIRSRYQAPAQRRLKLHTTFEQLWIRRHSDLMDFGRARRPDRYLMLRGELFFEEPVIILRQLCQWMGLDESDAAVAAMLRPEDSPYARPGPENARLGNNPGFLENPALRIGPLKPQSLEGPLEWSDDPEARFDLPVRNFASLVGYGE